MCVCVRADSVVARVYAPVYSSLGLAHCKLGRLECQNVLYMSGGHCKMNHVPFPR